MYVVILCDIPSVMSIKNWEEEQREAFMEVGRGKWKWVEEIHGSGSRKLEPLCGI